MFAFQRLSFASPLSSANLVLGAFGLSARALSAEKPCRKKWRILNTLPVRGDIRQPGMRERGLVPSLSCLVSVCNNLKLRTPQVCNWAQAYSRFHRTRMIKYPIYAIYIQVQVVHFLFEEAIFTKNFNLNADKQKKSTRIPLLKTSLFCLKPLYFSISSFSFKKSSKKHFHIIY